LTENATLTVNNTIDIAENASIRYQSSDASVATIDENGKITLVGIGKTDITVTFEETTNYNAT